VDTVSIHAFGSDDLPWAEQLVNAGFGGRLQARRGELIDALGCPGLVAERGGMPVGVLTYQMNDSEAEIVYIEATEKLTGVGSALLNRFLSMASGRRVWLVTTNDNLDALRFYQRRGFAISEFRRGAVDDARRTLKPQIASVGDFGIPMRDELELEYFG
jgi:GNAT superfamily N-acetyltransferase